MNKKNKKKKTKIFINSLYNKTFDDTIYLFTQIEYREIIKLSDSQTLLLFNKELAFKKNVQ